MRFRAPFLAVVLTAGSVALPHLAHAAIPFFGPIIPENVDTCAAGWGLLIVVINNIISLGITLALTLVAPLMIAYAGFLYVVNPVDPSGISKAKGILWNTVIGLVVALGAWLIVDAVMVTLTKQSVSSWADLVFSNGGDMCLPVAGALNQVGVTGVGSGTSSLTIAPGVPTMSSAAITAAAANAKQYQSQVCAAATANGLPADQCNQLLGILGAESNGNPGVVSSAGAIGLMQLTPSTAASLGVPGCVSSPSSAACTTALKDPTTSITYGTKLYAQLYNHFNGDMTYATAAYNAGSGTGVNPDGTKQAFAPSTDCPGKYAWQCTTNSGGFAETQRYVPNVAAIAAKVAGN